MRNYVLIFALVVLGIGIWFQGWIVHVAVSLAAATVVSVLVYDNRRSSGGGNGR